VHAPEALFVYAEVLLAGMVLDTSLQNAFVIFLPQWWLRIILGEEKHVLKTH